MKRKFSKLLKLINKILYISSAAMLIAGVFLTTAPQAVQASCPGCEEMKLNLSHISCASNKVEIHFVLLNVPSGKTPGALTFKVKVNGGAETTFTIPSPTNRTGNVWHYYYYATVNGKYDVTWAQVMVGSTPVSLHNPHDYKDEYQNCVITDLCTNIPGNQTTMPAGYEDPDHDKVCTLIPPVDLCTNIPGNQSTMPPGYEDPDHDKFCTLIPPVDLCTNIPGNQSTMPPGYEDPDADKVCTAIPVDLCTNLEGTQTTIPDGYEDPDADKVCTAIPVDLCTNLEGTQTTIPDGYEDPDGDKVCTAIPVDLCTNLEGTQTTIPQGYEDPDHDGVCTVIPTDLCTNLEGTQTTIPDGYEDPDHDGVCTVIPTDVCNNIEGVQTEIPEGMISDGEGGCVKPPEDVCNNIEGTQTEIPEGMISDGEGGCVKPPEDVCNNIEGTQTEIPEGMVSDGEGGCVKPSEPSGGCTDPTALNYDPAATEDDGSCTYKKANPKKPLKVEIDPFCNAEGLMQWTVINPNSSNITISHFTVDGVNHAGKSVPPGEHNLVATPLGTHTVVIYFNDADSASLTYTINVCPLPIPVTGGEEGAIIPVTGADETANLGMGISFAGMSMIGLALLLSALRKMYRL